MPPRKGKVSQRRSIGPRKKRRKFNLKSDLVYESSSAIFVDYPTSQSKDCATENDEKGWKTAWRSFFIEKCQTEEDKSKISPGYEEKVDSDNCTADVFYVIVHKVVEYSHSEDLDVLVAKLRREFTNSRYINLQDSVGDNRLNWGPLHYMNSDDHGLRFVGLYRHKMPLSMKSQLLITPSLKPVLFVHGQRLREDHDFWIGLPKNICAVKDILVIITRLSSLDICIGNPESEFVSIFPVGFAPYEKQNSKQGAYREEVSAERDGLEYESTIRSRGCSIFSRIYRCKQCQLYRNTLRKKKCRQKAKNE